MGGRRALVGASLAALVASLSGHARASGAWIPSGTLAPVEQRIAVSVGPDRTTMWTSLRFDASAGKVGIVVPAPPGSSLDFSSDAWFEALDVATAPRVFPPGGESPYCPGASGPTTVFDITSPLAHVVSLPVDDVVVLDDAAAVVTWAEQGGLALSPALAASLGGIGGERFIAVRFVAAGGSALTRTLRVAMPGAPAMLPLALTRAGAKPLLVTSWMIGEGRAQPSGSTPVTIPPSEIAWDAKDKKSNYEEARAAILAAEGSDGFLTECAGTTPLATNVAIADGTASIDGLVTAFFERTAAYGDGLTDPASCIAAAAVALTSSAPVAASCPRASLGVIDPAAPCVESVPPGGVDPAKLRCGAPADDLAVALSGLNPGSVWVTRQSAQIPAGTAGVDWPLTFKGTTVVSPVSAAKSLNLEGCGGAASTSSGGMSASGATASSSGVSSSSGLIFVGVGGSSMSVGSGEVGGDDSSGSGSFDGRPLDVGCGCSGTVDTVDTVDTSDTSTDSSASCDGGSDTSSGSCSGDSSGSDSCSGDSSGGDACDGSSSSGESCDSSGGDASCDSGGGSGDCSVRGSRGHKRSSPRFSVLALALIALLAPLRRRGRRSRRVLNHSSTPAA